MYNFEENCSDVAVLWLRSMEFAIAADDRSIEKYNTYMIEKHKLISESDGLEISVLTCADDHAPKAVFQIVHGMCEHRTDMRWLFTTTADTAKASGRSRTSAISTKVAGRR